MSVEFQEIGHCGGKIIISVSTNKQGQRQYQFTVTHSAPCPASIYAIYALPEGLPMSMISMGGIGQAWNSPPHPNCVSVFIASDSEGKFGHECPKCKGYWRSDSAPATWPTTCPYCGLRLSTHHFLTQGQRKYVHAYCDLFNVALCSEKDGDYEINMDEVAKAIGNASEKPKFYYAEESQQTRFVCSECGGWNDILGNFGHCSSCGTRNDLVCVEGKISKLRDKLNAGETPSEVLKDGASVIETMIGKYVASLLTFVPLTKRRINKLSNGRFHNIGTVREIFLSCFDIDLFLGLDELSSQHLIRMFHRRHVHEHKGGEVDQKYLDDTGDANLRLGQRISETKDELHKFFNESLKLAQNLHAGFHELYPIQKTPIEYERSRRDNLKRNS